MSDIPRRIQMQQWCDAEREIYKATRAVEAMAADVRLTDAVVLLGAARDRVADFVDGVEGQRTVPSGAAPAPPPPDANPAGYATLRDVVSAFLRLADVRLDRSANASFTHGEIERLRAAYDNDWGGPSAPTQEPELRRPNNPHEADQLARLEAGDREGFKRALLESVQLYADVKAGRTCMGSPVIAENVLAGIEHQVEMLWRGVGSPQPAPDLTNIIRRAVRAIGELQIDEPARDTLQDLLADLKVWRGASPQPPEERKDLLTLKAGVERGGAP